MQEFSEVEAVASRNRLHQILATNASRAVTMVTVFPVPVAHPLKLREDTTEPLVSFSYLHRLVEQHLALGAFGFKDQYQAIPIGLEGNLEASL